MADERGITPQTLRQLIDYDPETGEMVWLPRSPALFSQSPNGRTAAHKANNWNALYAGKPAPCHGQRGYLTVCLFGRNYLAHRVAYALYHGRWPRYYIDHINGNRSDNRVANLRDVSKVENCKNICVRSDSKTGVAGVERLSSKQNPWRAYIRVAGRNMHLGCFPTLADAKNAREAAKLKYGYHPNHGRSR